MKLDSTIKKANKPDIRELKMWQNKKGQHFTLQIIVPHYHDLSQVKAAFHKLKNKEEVEAREEVQEIFVDATIDKAKAAVVGWKNLIDDDGKEIAYSMDTLAELFRREDMLGWCNKFSTYYNTLQQEVMDTDFWTGGFTPAEEDESLKK